MARDFTSPAKVPVLAAPCLPQPSQQKEIEQLGPISLSDPFKVPKALDVGLGPAVRLRARKQDEGLPARALDTSTLMKADEFMKALQLGNLCT